MPREAISKGLRVSILTRDNYTCQYCGARAPYVELQMEHVIAVVDGGANHPSNLVTACRDCNAGKGSRSLRLEPSGSPIASYPVDYLYMARRPIRAVVIEENRDRQAEREISRQFSEQWPLLMDRIAKAQFSAVMKELSHDGRDDDGYIFRKDLDEEEDAA